MLAPQPNARILCFGRGLRMRIKKVYPDKEPRDSDMHPTFRTTIIYKLP
jgi:hypothetical protein